MQVGIGEKADLYEGYRDRSITPGLQLTAIDSQGGDTFDALGPLARLLMVSKFASERKQRAVIGIVSGIDQPAIELDAGAGACWRHARVIRRQHMLKLGA